MRGAQGDSFVSEAAPFIFFMPEQIKGARASAASQLTGHKAPILQLKAGSTGLASGDRSGALAVWDLTAGTASWKAQNAHDGHVTALAWAQPLLSSPMAVDGGKQHGFGQGSARRSSRASEEGLPHATSSEGSKLGGRGTTTIQLTASSASGSSQQGDDPSVHPLMVSEPLAESDTRCDCQMCSLGAAHSSQRNKKTLNVAAQALESSCCRN